jgi:hypothetical protein
MKEKTCEDMFTPEGIPMTSPHEAGMPGTMYWMNGRKRTQSAEANDRKKDKA